MELEYDSATTVTQHREHCMEERFQEEIKGESKEEVKPEDEPKGKIDLDDGGDVKMEYKEREEYWKKKMEYNERDRMDPQDEVYDDELKDPTEYEHGERRKIRVKEQNLSFMKGRNLNMKKMNG